MLKLLIADDERIIRETISTLIDWKKYGITVIGCCSNGMQAYDIILDESPNIVLTDIRMPGMNGLELIRNIYQADLGTQFIILSGYGEFEYAKEAMKFGVKHYLLKPCNETQIIECIEQCKLDCERSLSYKNRIPYSLYPPTDSIAGRICEYVECHIQDSNLTLKYIAEKHLFMNVDYVSKKFYKETGQKFSQYLTTMRIKKAKELILTGKTTSITLLAEQVGCGNSPQYFSQLFKKQTGTTPTEYISQIYPSHSNHSL